LSFRELYKYSLQLCNIFNLYKFRFANLQFPLHLIYKIMYLKKLVPFVTICLVGVLSSCQSESDVLYPENDILAPTLAAKNLVKVKRVRQALDLGLAGEFAILSQSGVTDVYPSFITGDVGSSPITGAAILVTCAEVEGTIYSVNAAGPLPCVVNSATRLTTAVGDMGTAYTDAAGRSNPDHLELGAGNIGGFTLTPGLYKWTSPLIIPADITISGGPEDVWIFQISQTLIMSSAVRITLSGGAQAKNIFWQVAGAVTLGTTSHFEGIILGKTGINMLTGATSNGRMLAQTAVVLQMATITQP
jgi:hypothetical protein